MSSGKVGSKGELFPPKSIRDSLGLESGDKVNYRIVQGKLIVEKIRPTEELLGKKGKIEVDPQEL
ncbi:MAG: AbrB/MazE/SpoVT family DNA-binding domain-containing protein [Candidatus Heimdallarchaeota archaeon]|nr:AbrB/MazE/SpoVT family DNA-binding domain-containing protein [Candidatus Heimdallarchaeota archaeon]